MSVADNLASFLAKLPKGVTLLPVSKTKPASVISEAHAVGQLAFGENYVQELCQKAKELPGDIRWHLIGHLQSNKVSQMVRDVPNLWMVESVDSTKLATTLNSACIKFGRRDKLNVLVEVATSNEGTKSGIEPSEAQALALFIMNECPALAFRGLMTVADPNRPTECFSKMAELRQAVAVDQGLGEQDLIMSMGMSGDWEEAVKYGSTEIRVGSAIFGSR